MHTKLCLLIIGLIGLNYCSAAPNEMLPRPSPINPDIPMEPKPAERITLITDPKEIAKFKREIKVESTTSKPLTNIHPAIHQTEHIQQHQQQQQEKTQQQQYQRYSRDISERTSDKPQIMNKQKSETALNEKQKQAENLLKQGTTNSIASSTTTVASIKRHRNHQNSHTSTQTPVSSTTTPSHSADATIKHRQKRDEKPLINRDQQQLHQNSQSSIEKTQEHLQQEHAATVRPLTLPKITNNNDQQQSQEMNVKSKRDIPVPLVPKHKHPEESSKPSNTDDSSSNINSTNEHSITTSSTIDQQHIDQQQKATLHSSTSQTPEPSIFRHHPVPVAELFAKSKSAEMSEQSHHDAN